MHLWPEAAITPDEGNLDKSNIYFDADVIEHQIVSRQVCKDTGISQQGTTHYPDILHTNRILLFMAIGRCIDEFFSRSAAVLGPTVVDTV